MKTRVDKTTPTITINKINIQSRIESRLQYTGRVSGKSYEWHRAGEIVEVDESDVPELLAKRLGGSQCCGGTGGNLIFEQVSGG